MLKWRTGHNVGIVHLELTPLPEKLKKGIVGLCHLKWYGPCKAVRSLYHVLVSHHVRSIYHVLVSQHGSITFVPSSYDSDPRLRTYKVTFPLPKSNILGEC